MSNGLDYFYTVSKKLSESICVINALIISDTVSDEMKEPLRYAVKQLEKEAAIANGFKEAGYERDLASHVLFSQSTVETIRQYHQHQKKLMLKELGLSNIDI